LQLDHFAKTNTISTMYAYIVLLGNSSCRSTNESCVYVGSKRNIIVCFYNKAESVSRSNNRCTFSRPRRSPAEYNNSLDQEPASLSNLLRTFLETEVRLHSETRFKTYSRLLKFKPKPLTIKNIVRLKLIITSAYKFQYHHSRLRTISCWPTLATLTLTAPRSLSH
jgi:hypothetical protein